LQKPLKITKCQARALAMHAENGFTRQGVASGKDGAEQVIRRLGYLQIDTITRVERAHHHILWTRVPDYEPQHLSTLEQEPRAIFEYWAHAASDLPLESLRFALPRMLRARSRQPHWMPRQAGICDAILRRITKEGPLQAKDFEDPLRKRTGWWDWKPAKIALEHLFIEGRLLIKGRIGFQKVYDLADRVLPQITSLEPPTERDSAEYLVESTLQRLGLASIQDMTYLRRIGTKEVPDVIRCKLAKGELVAFEVEGIKQQYFAKTSFLETTPPRVSGARAAGQSWSDPEKQVAVLSPFDPFIINRKRLVELFDFDYRIECYVPKEKRVYGYFALPILWGDQFVGLVDTRADRKQATLVVESFHLTKSLQDDAAFFDALTRELMGFARFNRCRNIDFAPHRPNADRQDRFMPQLRKSLNC
jgi:uncharacterized protein YcaQ